MAESLGSRIRRGWNAFRNANSMLTQPVGEYASYYRPDRLQLTRRNERSIITSVFNRIALDVASTSIKHVRVDENGRYKETYDSSLNNCLNLNANLDQTSKEFIRDVVMSMFDEGCVAIVPIDTDRDPNNNDSFDIESMRTGEIITWFADKVQVRVYNEKTGQKEDIVIRKEAVAIIENPFYSIMNEPNSTLQRLIRKLNLLDAIDEQSGSGKLDLIIQLPYVVKSEGRKQQAEERRKDIERQLSGSKYGIAYTDGTERVTQLNRPAENNLMKQVEYLTSMLYSQLGITQEILDGSADEKTMTNYNSRIVEPILSAIVDSIKWKFLTKTARTQGQSVLYFKDPFKLVPVSEIANIADKMTRNEIMSSNEIRQVIGMNPSKDPKADELRNKNISQPKEQANENQQKVEEVENQNEQM